jgi:hypothetical protein
MRHRLFSLLAGGVLLASTGVLVGPGAAVAADPPVATPAQQSTAPVPVISPTSGPPGTVIAVTVPGCTGIVAVAIGQENADQALAVNAGQGPTVNITVPTSAPQGQLLVVAGCDVYTVNDLNATTFTVTAGAVAAAPHVTG